MNNRNLILAILLSVAILVLFQWLAPPPKRLVIPPSQTAATPATPGGTLAVGPEAAAAAAADRAEVLKQARRIAIDTPHLKGSIDLKGARLDDLTLGTYHETVDPESPAIVLLSPSGAPHAYLSEQGWIATTPDVKVPDSDTEWNSDAKALTTSSPATLTWDNGAGLVFTRTVSVDDNYMFTVKDSVANGGSAAVTLRPYALVARSGPPPVSSTWVSYEGPIGAFNGVEEDVKYTAIKDLAPVKRDSAGGWLGFSDKYWLAAVAPADQDEHIAATFQRSGDGETQKFQVDYLGAERQAPPGGSVSSATLVFAGAKEVKLLALYRDTLKLPRFDNAVDFAGSGSSPSRSSTCWTRFISRPAISASRS